MKLTDYHTNESIRKATESEHAESIAAARHDGGAGVITVPDHDGPVYVEGDPMTEVGQMRISKNSAFWSAAEAGRMMGNKAAKLIRAQPGYRRGHKMRIGKTDNGGKRLYVEICGQWMDGSLQDMAI